mgnify:CR=1 FL=1
MIGQAVAHYKILDKLGEETVGRDLMLVENFR